MSRGAVYSASLMSDGSPAPRQPAPDGDTSAGKLRRPRSGLPWEPVVEDTIRRAQSEGQFDKLEGAGKPIADFYAPYDPMWWVKKLLRRERVDALPESLAIRGRIERELDRLAALPSEAAVRARVAELNAEIARLNRSAVAGPPTTLAPLDPDAEVARWRARRRA